VTKQTALKYLNALLGIAFLGVICALFSLKTGIVTNPGIVEVHEVCGIILSIGVIIHLILNRKWIQQVYFNPEKQD
jgi:hypothetical protein